MTETLSCLFQYLAHGKMLYSLFNPHNNPVTLCMFISSFTNEETDGAQRLNNLPRANGSTEYSKPNTDSLAKAQSVRWTISRWARDCPSSTHTVSTDRWFLEHLIS